MEGLEEFMSDAEIEEFKDMLYKGAHKHSMHNRKEIRKSDVCGCFQCLKIYPASRVVEWTDKEETALCPKCGVDSVIGEESRYPITRKFLSNMYERYFTRKTGDA